MTMAGPLAGTRIVEMVGLGPGPFCGMLLADLGADVLTVDRADAARAVDRTKPATSAMTRSKHAIGLDLKSPDGVETFLRLCDGADAAFEVFRPGVVERLGIGPEVACARNPGLVYGRLTGYGQTGPLADKAGHDIDYLAIAGALEPLGRAGQPPTPPINVLADFAGGGMLLAYGIVAALFARARTGRGQVVDAAMVDGAATMLTPFYAARASGFWGERGTNMLDTGAPWYDTYETSDGQWLSVGSIEPQFYAQLLTGLGLATEELPDQHDRAGWPVLRERFRAVIAQRTRDEWEATFADLDACVAPALTPLQAPTHPHNVARESFLEIRGVPQPAPAPRFSDTRAPAPRAPEHPGEQTDAVLTTWGFTAGEVTSLVERGILV
jgi:alpha-methylacyl-CoA racemase